MNDWIKHAGQIQETLVTHAVQLPAPNSGTDSLARLGANGREKTDKVIPCAAHSSSGPKVKSQEVKAFLQVITRPIVILAIDDLGLLRMEFQMALRQPPGYDILKPEGLSLTLAVHKDVVGLALEGNHRIMSLHPHIKGIVQEEIGQQWTDHSALRRPLLPDHQCSIR
jgi:hypothetical protein